MPPDGAAKAPTKAQEQAAASEFAALTEGGVTFVWLLWVGSDGVRRCRRVPPCSPCAVQDGVYHCCSIHLMRRPLSLMAPAVWYLSCCSVVPAARWEDAQQHGVGLVPGLVAMLPHAPLIAESSGITISGEVRGLNIRRGSEVTWSRWYASEDRARVRSSGANAAVGQGSCPWVPLV